jgi:hypothetical protein
MNTESIARRCLPVALFALSLVCLANTSRATVLSYTPDPADLYDLDHHYSYSWRIDNINLPTNAVIDSATITFSNIANWDSTPNMLFVYLLDTATHSGVNSVQDHPLDESPVGDITDHFANGFNVSAGLISSTTKMTKLFQQSFTTTPITYTFTFTGAELTTLMNYIDNGHDVALGFDPECHFFNDGITFTFDYVTPVPEMANGIPVFCLVAIAIGFELRRRRSMVKA